MVSVHSKIGTVTVTVSPVSVVSVLSAVAEKVVAGVDMAAALIKAVIDATESKAMLLKLATTASKK